MCFDVEEVQEAIDQVVDDIGSNPFIIHNETDIHAMLYSRLIDKHNETYPINLKYRNEPVNDKNGNNFQTGLVHCEYFFGKDEKGKHNKKRFDLVIFDKNHVEDINNNWSTQGTINNYDIINLKHVIEVKCELGGGGPKNRQFETSLAKKDVNKLIEFRKSQEKKPGKSPYLHFVYVARWVTDKKRGKTEIENLIKELKNYCNDNNVKFYSRNTMDKHRN